MARKYENSLADRQADRKSGKKVTKGREGSAPDRRADAGGQRKMGKDKRK